MIRRFLSLFLLAATSAAFGDAFEYLAPKDARAMALGGTYTALTGGFSAFYGNPAGFASGKGELTIADLATWGYFRPSTDNVNKAMRLIAKKADKAEVETSVNDFVVENGFGGGASAGLGYTGKGIGLGLLAISDAYASGLNIMGANLSSYTSVNVIVGLGVPVPLGNATLKIGGDARPFYRVDSAGSWSLLNLVLAGQDIQDNPVTAGFGLAMDLGASLEMGSLSFGLTIRDISPSLYVDNYSLGDILGSLGGGDLAQPTDSKRTQPRPYAALGVSWAPRVWPRFVDPALYFEMRDPVGVVMRRDSVWNLFHAGVELKLASVMSARAGLNQGWLCFGFGLDLVFVKLDAAVFTEELGRHPGDQPRTGVVLQTRIKI